MPFVSRVSRLAQALGLALSLMPVAAARGADGGSIPRLHPGAIEVGLAASLVSIEGSNRADAVLRGGTFGRFGQGLAGFEFEVDYGHVSSLDQLGFHGSLSWQPDLRQTAALPFIAVGGGVRQEWLGSFRQARYPIGMTLGLRLLVGPRACVRTEYRFLRVLQDPVADFTEHRVLTGFSLLFRNR
jgi:hypothetical protein